MKSEFKFFELISTLQGSSHTPIHQMNIHKADKALKPLTCSSNNIAIYRRSTLSHLMPKIFNSSGNTRRTGLVFCNI